MPTIDDNETAMSHDDLVTLTRWMSENGYSSDELAYAVEKPWKYLDELTEAKTSSR